jgi:hypothetical protein
VIEDDSNTATQRDSKGKWLAGRSANPAGRPPGSGVIGELRRQILTQVPEVLGKLLEQALAGDVQAARLLLERVLPAVKPQAAPIILPGLAEADGLAHQGAVVIRAVAAGELAPNVGAVLLAGLGQQGRLIEIAELEDRVAALERRR